MFDSHCHLHDARMDPGPALERARLAGVRGFVLAGVQPTGWSVEDRLAAQHADVAVSYGVHPQVVAESSPAEVAAMLDELPRALQRRGAATGSPSRVVAVGEIGLDAVGERKTSLGLQEEAMRAQLAVARAVELPVILHILRAQGRALSVLRDAGLPRAGGVVHSYSGAGELVPRYVELGLYISFAGAVTFGGSHKVHEAVRRVPRERLLVETDAPDQTPESCRPSPNEPAFLVAVIAAVARLRGESPSEVAAYTEENARRLFGLTSPRLNGH